MTLLDICHEMKYTNDHDLLLAIKPILAAPIEPFDLTQVLECKVTQFMREHLANEMIY